MTHPSRSVLIAAACSVTRRPRGHLAARCSAVGIGAQFQQPVGQGLPDSALVADRAVAGQRARRATGRRRPGAHRDRGRGDRRRRGSRGGRLGVAHHRRMARGGRGDQVAPRRTRRAAPRAGDHRHGRLHRRGGAAVARPGGVAAAASLRRAAGDRSEGRVPPRRRRPRRAATAVPRSPNVATLPAIPTTASSPRSSRRTGRRRSGASRPARHSSTLCRFRILPSLRLTSRGWPMISLPHGTRQA